MNYASIKYFVISILTVISIVLTLVVLEISIRWQEKIFPPNAYKPPSIVKSITDEVLLRKIIQDRGVSTNTFNIYYFGESSMWGEPYIDTIPVLVEKMLGGKINNKEIKWVNMASPGIGYCEVDRRLKQIVNNKNIYFPSLIIIYSGHNEFLQYQDGIGFSFQGNKTNWMGKAVLESRLAHKIAQIFKIYKLEIDDRKFFDKPVVSIEWYSETINKYVNMVNSTISYLQENEVPVIVSTVVGNYADFEPNRSVFTANELKKNEFKNYMDKGLELTKQGKTEEALFSYQKALKIDDKFAETHYRLGQIYRKLGHNDKAWTEFMLAVDNDMMPLRATSVQNDFIRNIRESSYVKVIDPVMYLKQSSMKDTIGYNYFFDGIHPNLEGYRLISEMFAKKIAKLYKNESAFVPLTKADAEKIFNSDQGLYNAYSSRADWLIRIATWRYDPTQRLNDADYFLTKAHSIFEGNAYWNLSKMTIYYLRNDIKTAKIFYKNATDLNPKEAREYLKNNWINQVITRALN